MIQVNIATENTRTVVESLGPPPSAAPMTPRGSQDEPAPEPEPQTSQILRFEDITVELVDEETALALATTKYNLDVYEEQSRLTMYGTADADESDDVFHDLEGSFRLAGITKAEAGGGVSAHKRSAVLVISTSFSDRLLRDRRVSSAKAWRRRSTSPQRSSSRSGSTSPRRASSP